MMSRTEAIGSGASSLAATISILIARACAGVICVMSRLGLLDGPSVAVIFGSDAISSLLGFIAGCHGIAAPGFGLQQSRDLLFAPDGISNGAKFVKLWALYTHLLPVVTSAGECQDPI
jgi:hypothetical protein